MRFPSFLFNRFPLRISRNSLHENHLAVPQNNTLLISCFRACFLVSVERERRTPLSLLQHIENSLKAHMQHHVCFMYPLELVHFLGMLRNPFSNYGKFISNSDVKSFFKSYCDTLYFLVKVPFWYILFALLIEMLVFYNFLLTFELGL